MITYILVKTEKEVTGRQSRDRCATSQETKP